ncbi:MAG: hypothetical protein HY648_02140 [Acidobacteria bacterium]|nr:hypothetical protein [Acidobacteriota bacterium]
MFFRQFSSLRFCDSMLATHSWRRLRRTAFLLIFLLPFSPAAKGGALSNESLQGAYFFTYQKIDTLILFGFSFATATGTITFDGKGNATVQGLMNRSNFSTLQPFVGTGTYSLESSGAIQISLPIIPTRTSGSVSFDLSSMLTSSVGAADSSLLSQETLLATRLPSPLVGEALLKGKYFLAERTITSSSSGSTPQFENAQGTITFDGQGNFSLSLQRNRDGLTVPVTDSGKYLITGSGSFSLTFPGRSDPVLVGFTENGSFGAGVTVTAGSKATHDLFVLNKGDESGLGNAGLNGSYEVVMGTYKIVSPSGFATAAGLVDYMGPDQKGVGTGFYQLAQNEMGFVGSKQGPTTFSVANDASLQLYFADLLSFPNTFQGGLGNLGYSLVGASVNDSAYYNFLVGIRTPSQPAAAANAASFAGSTALSPGGLFTIFGRNLARLRLEGSYVPCPDSGEPNCLPKLLGRASVKIGGMEAPLRFVSPFQINAQAPFELPAGQTSITIVLDGVESGPLQASVNATGPGLFGVFQDGKGMGVFQHGADFSLVTETNPARPGETVIIYCTGLGTVSPTVQSGLGVPVSPEFRANTQVSVRIGSRDIVPSFAGLTSGFAGLYQINVTIPPDITSAQTLPLVVTAGGIQSNTVSIPVAP